MKATIDQAGRIQLDKELQIRLGVKPGDEIVLEQRGGEWVITLAQASGLCWEGNVLVHRDVCTEPLDEELARFREERLRDLGEGLGRRKP